MDLHCLTIYFESNANLFSGLSFIALFTGGCGWLVLSKIVAGLLQSDMFK